MVSTQNRKPAPIGVVTRWRLFVLEAVSAGRVRWLIDPQLALYLPPDGDEPAEVTETFVELIRARWAVIVPWDENEIPRPAQTTTAPTGLGVDVLIEARQRARARAKQRRKR